MSVAVSDLTLLVIGIINGIVVQGADRMVCFIKTIWGPGSCLNKS